MIYVQNVDYKLLAAVPEPMTLVDMHGRALYALFVKLTTTVDYMVLRCIFHRLSFSRIEGHTMAGKTGPGPEEV